MKKMPKYYIKTIILASDVLNCLMKTKKAITLTEISELINLYPSTVYRILETLKYLKYVYKLPDSDKYQLGHKVLELGRAKIDQDDLAKEVMPFLNEILKKYDENVYLAKLFDGMVFYIAKLEADRAVRINTHLGKRAYFNCTALGKILVSFLPKNEREEIYKSIGFHKCTRNSITNKSKFEEEVAKVKKQGFSVDNEEYEEDIQCIAVPIRNYLGKVVTALSISGPSYRFDVERESHQMKTDLINWGIKISKELGYKT